MLRRRYQVFIHVPRYIILSRGLVLRNAYLTPCSIVPSSGKRYFIFVRIAKLPEYLWLSSRCAELVKQSEVGMQTFESAANSGAPMQQVCAAKVRSGKSKPPKSRKMCLLVRKLFRYPSSCEAVSFRYGFPIEKHGKSLRDTCCTMQFSSGCSFFVHLSCLSNCFVHFSNVPLANPIAFSCIVKQCTAIVTSVFWGSERFFFISYSFSLKK